MFGAITLFLSGCAASSDKYPSLAIRDFEKAAQGSEGAPLPSATTLSNSTESALQDARKVAARRHASFNSALPDVRSKVAAARRGGQTSNAWSIAQIAIADLTSYRSQTAIALGNIDAILAKASADLVDVSPHLPIQGEVTGMLEQQDRTLAQLRRSL